jgi:AcrR family transcriptional regulator
MAFPKKTVISARKHPKQTRSTQLVADVLEAAIRVLKSEGTAGFTMARVAEVAGVSVGSIYQYFPTKEAILFRLQSDEWTKTLVMLEGILTATTTPPLERLRAAVYAFILSEHDEADLRIALDAAAPFHRDTPEASAIRTTATRCIDTFLSEAAPGASANDRALAGDVIITSLSAIGKTVSEQNRSLQDLHAFARAIGDMLCAYLDRLNSIPAPREVHCSAFLNASANIGALLPEE